MFSSSSRVPAQEPAHVVEIVTLTGSEEILFKSRKPNGGNCGTFGIPLILAGQFSEL